LLPPFLGSPLQLLLLLLLGMLLLPLLQPPVVLLLRMQLRMLPLPHGNVRCGLLRTAAKLGLWLLSSW
jgi:hypothetical protein